MAYKYVNDTSTATTISNDQCRIKSVEGWSSDVGSCYIVDNNGAQFSTYGAGSVLINNPDLNIPCVGSAVIVSDVKMSLGITFE